MKKLATLFATLIALSCTIGTFAKKNRSAPLEEVRKGVVVENFMEGITEFPKYPGGEYALAWHYANTKFVSELNGGFRDGLELVLGFDIKNDGSLDNIEVTPVNRPELDHIDKDVIKRVERSVGELANWIPAKNYEEPTTSRLSMRIIVDRTYIKPCIDGGL